MKSSATPRHLVRFCTVVAWMMLQSGLLAAAPAAAGGKVSTLAATAYRITLEAPQVIFQGQDAPVVVHVQNRQGLPVDGIAVVFKIAPPRVRYASIQPARAHTEDGRVDAILRSDLIGRLHITARVGTLTKQAPNTVVMPIARRPRLPAGHTAVSPFLEERVHMVTTESA